jgi:hypothetical protein
MKREVTILLVLFSLVYCDWPQYLQNSQHTSFVPSSNGSLWCPTDDLWRQTEVDVWNAIAVGDSNIFSIIEPYLNHSSLYSSDQFQQPSRSQYRYLRFHLVNIDS